MLDTNERPEDVTSMLKHCHCCRRCRLQREGAARSSLLKAIQPPTTEKYNSRVRFWGWATEQWYFFIWLAVHIIWWENKWDRPKKGIKMQFKVISSLFKSGCYNLHTYSPHILNVWRWHPLLKCTCIQKKVIWVLSFDNLSEALLVQLFLFIGKKYCFPLLVVHFHCWNKKQLFTWMALNWSGCCIACFFLLFLCKMPLPATSHGFTLKGILSPIWPLVSRPTGWSQYPLNNNISTYDVSQNLWSSYSTTSAESNFPN